MGQAPHLSRGSSIPALLVGLRWAGWITPTVGLVVTMLAAGNGLQALFVGIPPEQRTMFDALVLPFFAMVIVRLLIGARMYTTQRLPLVQLALGLTLWALSSIVSQAVEGTPQPLQSPAVSDGIYLAGAICVGGYIALGRSPRASVPLVAWLNVAVGSGALVALFAAFGEMGPARELLSHTPVSLFIDIALAILVVTQCLQHRRSWSVSGVRLLIGLSLMATSDVTMRAIISGGATVYPMLLDLMWAVAIMLFADAALTPEPAPVSTSPINSKLQGMVTVGGAALALLVLALLPPGPSRTLALAPALLAMTAAAGQAALALSTARTAAEAVRQSLTDGLTGLPNRRAVETHLTERAEFQQTYGAMLIDLRGFKDINDTLGHRAGDAFLQVIATRLRDATPTNAMVARLAADEFSVIYEGADPDDIARQAEELRAILRRPVAIEGLNLTPDCAIGMSISMDCSPDLLRQADIALYHAKRTGRTVLFDPSLDTYSRARLELGEELRRALVTDQLELWYQPQLNMRTDHVDAVEALIRWRHPVRGIVPPAEFLDAARRLGLMPTLTEITLRLACRQAAQWRKQGLRMRLAVNIGADELLNQPLIGLLMELVATEGLPPRSITIEVTEESFLADRIRAQEVIKMLDAGGIDVSVDDYGTGFSSLSYLRHLPLRELKIDRTFVMQVCDDRRSRTIVAATAALAHALDMRVIAEGVETEEMLTALLELPIDHAQGYHIARPMPPEEATQWLRLHAAPSTRLPIPPQRRPGRVHDQHHQIQIAGSTASS